MAVKIAETRACSSERAVGPEINDSAIEVAAILHSMSFNVKNDISLDDNKLMR